MKFISIATIFAIFSYAITARDLESRNALHALPAEHHGSEKRAGAPPRQTVEITYMSNYFLAAPITQRFVWDQWGRKFDIGNGPYQLQVNPSSGSNVTGYGNGNHTIPGAEELSVSFNDFFFTCKIDTTTGVLENMAYTNGAEYGIRIANANTGEWAWFNPQSITISPDVLIPPGG